MRAGEAARRGGASASAPARSTRQITSHSSITVAWSDRDARRLPTLRAVRSEVPSLTSRFRFPRVAGAVIALFVAVPLSRDAAQRVLTVIARDKSLEASPTVPAGITTIRLKIDGAVRRELVVHRV